MKTRNGFVSNSSSSSFVVCAAVPHFRREEDREESEISVVQDQLLDLYGFWPTKHSRPEHVVDREHDAPNRVLKGESAGIFGRYKGYAVSCNQSDPMFFLIFNRISFRSSDHYGDADILYDGKTDKLVTAQNYGKQMYNIEHWSDPDYARWLKKSKPVEVSTGKQWLRDIRRWDRGLKSHLAGMKEQLNEGKKRLRKQQQ